MHVEFGSRLTTIMKRKIGGKEGGKESEQRIPRNWIEEIREIIDEN